MLLLKGFLLYEASDDKKLVNLRLPSGVRNIPIRPMHTTTAITLASEDTVFVAGVRKYLYLWNVSNAQVNKAPLQYYYSLFASSCLHHILVLIKLNKQ